MNTLTYTPCRRIYQYRDLADGNYGFRRAFFEFNIYHSDCVVATFDQETQWTHIPSVGRLETLRFDFNPRLKMRTVNKLGRELLPLFEQAKTARLAPDFNRENIYHDFYAICEKIERKIAATEFEEL